MAKNDVMTRQAWLAVMTLGLAVAHPASADTWRPLEVWRIEGGRVAPWAPPGTRIDRAHQGREVRFQADRVIAPDPMACDGASK